MRLGSTPDRRLPVRDLTWSPFTTLRAAGPLRVPPVEQVRDVLRELHSRRPDHPLVSGLDAARRRVRRLSVEQLEGHLRQAVRHCPGLDPAALVTALQHDGASEDLGRRDGSEPGLGFRLLLSDTAAGMSSAHVLGDGAVTNAWFAALLRTEAPDHPDHSARRDRGASWPLVRALLHHFGRDPRRLLRALRGSFPLSPPVGPGPRTPVRTGPATVVSVQLPPPARVPGAPSAAVTLMAETLRVLAEAGLAGEGVLVMMDCRRYLPPGRSAGGNFVTGPYLRSTRSDPAALGSAVRRAGTDGVPLLLLTALTLRNLVRPPGSRPTGTTGVPPRPRITLSHQGRLDPAALPWALEAGEPQLLIAGEPAGPDGVTVCFAPTPTGTTVTATLHAEVLAADRVRVALSQLADRGRRVG